MTDYSVHHAAQGGIGTDRDHASEESDKGYTFLPYELRAIHSTLITGLASLIEIERVHDLAQITPAFSGEMTKRKLMPLHPTGCHSAGEFCEALMYVHSAIFADSERRADA